MIPDALKMQQLISQYSHIRRVEMKRYCSFLVLFFVFLWSAASNAQVQVEVFGPTSCIRGTGEPVTETFTFPGVSGPATVNLWNGSLSDTSVEKVSSSVISVNGEVVFGSSIFNQNVSYLEKEVVLLEGQNTLEILLKGNPSGQVTIQMIQQVEAEAAALIGSEGGTVEVTDSGSALFGVQIQVPENVLDNTAYLIISNASESIVPPNDNINISPALEIECSAEFKGYMTVTCPLNLPITEDDLIIVSYYDAEYDKWGTLPIIDIDYENNTVRFMTYHLTTFFTQKAIMIIPDEKMTDFDIQTDCFNENFENDGVYCGIGVCSGMANFALWHYLNYGHGLRCLWDKEHSAAIACWAIQAIYGTWEGFLSTSAQHINFLGTKNLLLYSLNLGVPQVLNMKDSGGGHSVVVIGYKKVSKDYIEFYCYDVNHPLITKTIYCVRSLGLWYFNYPVYPNYFFFFPGDVGNEVNSIYENIRTLYDPDNWCVKPIVISSSPADGETGVSIALDQISVTFNKEMGDGYSLDGGFLNNIVTWASDRKTCYISNGTGTPLPPGATIQLILNPSSYPDGFHDIDGNVLETYTFSFTTDESEDVVTDTSTQLMWQQEDDGVRRTWDEACQYCEDLVLGTYEDWRVPRIDELRTIVDYGQCDPALVLVFEGQSDVYWSSSGKDGSDNPQGFYWYINFYKGNVFYTSASNFNFIRCVRSGPNWSFDPSDYLVIESEATVRDTRNDLIWQRSDDGIHRTWSEAQAYCEALILDGYDEWRVPTIEELQTIIDYPEGQDPRISTDVFSGIGTVWPADYFWSSTTSVCDPNYAWEVYFGGGYVSTFSKDRNYYMYTRCVCEKP